MSNRSTIQKLVTQFTWAEAALDDLVHDEASKTASAANNEGVKAQIEFIVAQGRLTEEDVLAEIEGAVPL